MNHAGREPPGRLALRQDRDRQAYADFEITEYKVTIHDPSEELVCQLLAMVIIEANPLDQALDLLDGSVWVQDPRFTPRLMPRWRSFTG